MSVINIKPNNIIKNAELNLISNNNFNVFDFGELSEVNYAINTLNIEVGNSTGKIASKIPGKESDITNFNYNLNLTTDDINTFNSQGAILYVGYGELSNTPDLSLEIDEIKNANIKYHAYLISPIRTSNKTDKFEGTTLVQRNIITSAKYRIVLDLSDAKEVDIDQFIGSDIKLNNKNTSGFIYLKNKYGVMYTGNEFQIGSSSNYLEYLTDSYKSLLNSNKNTVESIDYVNRIVTYDVEMPIAIQSNNKHEKGLYIEMMVVDKLKAVITHSNVYSSNPSNVKVDNSKEDTEELNDDVLLSIENNPFIHKNTKLGTFIKYTSAWSFYVYNKYKNTRQKCSITIRLGKYYDAENNLVYNESGYIKVNDKVVVYKLSSDNNEVPIIYDDKGNAMIFRVVSTELNYDNGKISITLILEENK